ncbi:dGTP triphosphohydrolase [Legionella birminghamensis]|uniref:Deoxyguanosinetriphosphate triphosphohydrolase-like protein n=1 Tax=Legionella birminghamensis TaxID=28083 RepID=A0A378JSC2_9GAMM|nr:anti-phage deoxyguanosine triphosphatase [Legionella birminghamensis]KTC71481.1 dGTP triphosphohydrolase [Legionella birminghamensis]STX60880.1 dGTP triphosphohydrolase [Legionella birminghamensis]
MDEWENRIFFDRRRESKVRCEFNRDRARVVHSAAFRRLQGKTQIFGLGESDFYRTRLTHSMEVAQISSGIVDRLNHTYQDKEDLCNILPSKDLIECIGLAHDIGHPPFGHGGEKALNYCLHKMGSGFEGNAQSYRVCTVLGEHSEEHGFNLTRRAILGIIKYPVELNAAQNLSIYKLNEAPLRMKSFKPPKCIYEKDRTFKWATDLFSEQDQKIFSFSEQQIYDHNKPKYKSFDCSIMELADDISYGIHDLEDAIALGFIEEKIFKSDVLDKLNGVQSDLKKMLQLSNCINDLFSNSSVKRKRVISDLIHYFIKNVRIVKQLVFDHWILDHKAMLPEHVTKELSIFKDLIVKYVINNKNVQMMEYCGEQIIIKLFEAICSNPDRLLPDDSYVEYVKNNDIRIISDYVSGMTDSHAIRIYDQIFSPEKGSMFRKI